METHRDQTRFYSILQSCLQGAIPLTTTQQNDNGPKAPGASQLLEAIHFSRRFLPTYYVALLFAILVASITHWNTRSARKKQLQSRWNEEKPSPQSTSSASSTLLGDDTSTSKSGAHAESTPLLEGRPVRATDRSFAARLYYRLRSLLLYQPQPIPALTASANHLPSNGTSLLVAIFFLLNVFYLCFNVPISATSIFVLGYRAGLLFAINLPVLYILGAKNNQPLKWLTGWPYEKLNIFHRRLGEWMVLLGILHAITMFLTFYAVIRPQGYSWGWFFSLPIIILGITALLSYVLIGVTSIGYVREKAYEFFLASHIVLQVVALFTLFFHSQSGKPYCGVALAIWALDRGVSRILISNQKFVATLEIAKDKETVLMYCDIVLDRSKRNDIRSGWRAGQHVFVSVPGMRWYHAFQAHPFTIASPAPSAVADGTPWPLQLVIRCQNGFSKELLAYAEFHQHAEVTLDGPYGDSELGDAVLSADRVCLVAGGSGITVTYPLAWNVWAKGKETSITSGRTVYHQGRKRTTNVLLRNSWTNWKRAHFWVRQIPEHGSWITMYPSHDSGLFLSEESSQCHNGVNLVSQTFETRQSAASRPDIATEIRAWLVESDNRDSGHGQRVCLVVSGPDGLVRDVKNCAAELAREGYDIEIHVEKFGW